MQRPSEGAGFPMVFLRHELSAVSAEMQRAQRVSESALETTNHVRVRTQAIHMLPTCYPHYPAGCAVNTRVIYSNPVSTYSRIMESSIPSQGNTLPCHIPLRLLEHSESPWPKRIPQTPSPRRPMRRRRLRLHSLSSTTLPVVGSRSLSTSLRIP